MTNDKIVANAMSCSCRQLSSNTVLRRYIQITDMASSTDMQRCATSCTNDKRWPFFQTNYMVVSMQPANSDVFCSPLPRPSHIPASPPGFGRAPHPLEWSHRDKLWHPSCCRRRTDCSAALPPAFQLAFLLTKLLTHFSELLHQGSIRNLIAFQLAKQLRILTAGHHHISPGRFHIAYQC